MSDLTDALSLLERVLDRDDLDPNWVEHNEGWSIKQVLGHLIDSAANNHKRLQDWDALKTLHLPGYQQDRSVRRTQYHEADYQDLKNLVLLYNRIVLDTLINSLPDYSKDILITIDGEEATVDFIAKDYVRHFKAHIEQIDRIIRANAD